MSVKAQTTLEGKVFDSISKSSVPYAEIYILELELFTRTDEVGHFLITSKLPNQYQVIVSALGYETQRLILQNKQTNIEFYLIESHSILRYICNKYDLPEQWYPRNNIMKQPKIN